MGRTQQPLDEESDSKAAPYSTLWYHSLGCKGLIQYLKRELAHPSLKQGDNSMLLESEGMGFYFPVCSALQTSPKHSFVSIMDPAIYLIRSTASQQGLDCIVCVPMYESHAYQNVIWKRITLDLFLFTR